MVKSCSPCAGSAVHLHGTSIAEKSMETQGLCSQAQSHFRARNRGRCCDKIKKECIFKEFFSLFCTERKMRQNMPGKLFFVCSISDQCHEKCICACSNSLRNPCCSCQAAPLNRLHLLLKMPCNNGCGHISALNSAPRAVQANYFSSGMRKMRD